MTDLLFNEMLGQEVRLVIDQYESAPHYQLLEYIKIAWDGPDHTAITKQFEIALAFDASAARIAEVMRKKGTTFGLTAADVQPETIFLVKADHTHNRDGSSGPDVVTIIGITNDGRSNLAVLEVQIDEDGRYWLSPTNLFQWMGAPTLQHGYVIDVLPYLEFFKNNDAMRLQES